MSAAAVVTRGLAKRFRDRPALAGVDLAQQGGMVVVLGPNGSGKTTLLRCLATVLTADSGSVTIDGLDPSREHERIEIRRRLGYLPQEIGVVPGANAFDVVDHLAVLKEMRDERARRRSVMAALERVGLGGRVGDRVEQLSTGMRRRLAIAQAILGSPSLLVLDEPAAGLDPDERLRLREILTERRTTTTIVVSTHLTDEAAVGDVVVVLVDGTIRFAGSPASLAARAAGRCWLQSDLPPPGVRASWRITDGRYRCLGNPPPGFASVEPTIEDGYLLLQGLSG